MTGSGKTTLAERIIRATSVPWYSVDDMTWQPGWVSVPVDEQRRRIEAICAGPGWILDTAYSPWLGVALARAEFVVDHDYPRLFSLQRLVRRTASRMVRGTRVCNGNRESLRTLFSKESIVWWHFVSSATSGPGSADGQPTATGRGCCATPAAARPRPGWAGSRAGSPQATVAPHYRQWGSMKISVPPSCMVWAPEIC